MNWIGNTSMREDILMSKQSKKEKMLMPKTSLIKLQVISCRATVIFLTLEPLNAGNMLLKAAPQLPLDKE